MAFVRFLGGALIGVMLTPLLSGHPMGNFSVSHFSKLEMGAGGIAINYVLDLAEIPTLELLQSWNLEASAPRTQLEQQALAQAREWSRNLQITVDGRRLAPHFETGSLTVARGAGDLPVFRIAAGLRVDCFPGRLTYQDLNYAERAGWKEIVVIDGRNASILKSNADTVDRSGALTAYPQDPAIVPPQVLAADVQWRADITPVPAPKRLEVTRRPAAPPVSVPASPQVVAPLPAAAPGAVVRGDFLSRLLGRKELGWGMVLLGIAAAFGLGAAHALSPGHGKTMVAAYLVGSRGTPWHAAVLGSVVTFTHTISVFLLGFVTLFLSAYIPPEKLYPVLGAISGITIIWLGGTLLYRRAGHLLHAYGLPHHHHHHHDHSHHHHDHHHHHDGHDQHGHSHVPQEEITLGSLIALGVSGGLVPCPSGLVLLLSSIAIGRVGLGLLLLTAFSAGLALVLTGIGMLVVYARQWLPEPKRAAGGLFFRLVPVVSACVILVVGVVMTGVSLGWIQPNRLIA
jgi:ABC-type nickel/cobalt efflux system permease component RcnA